MAHPLAYCHVHSIAIYVMRATVALPEHAREAVMHVKVHLWHAVVVLVVGDQQRHGAPGRHTHAAAVPLELQMPGAVPTPNYADLHAVPQVVAVQLVVEVATNYHELSRQVHSNTRPRHTCPLAVEPQRERHRKHTRLWAPDSYHFYGCKMLHAIVWLLASAAATAAHDTPSPFLVDSLVDAAPRRLPLSATGLGFLHPLNTTGLNSSVLAPVVASVGVPFPVTWEVLAPGGNLTLTVLNCPSVTLPVAYCTRWLSYDVRDTGAYFWVAPASAEESAKYRFQLHSVAAGGYSASAAFTVAPFLRNVSSKCVVAMGRG